MGSRRDWQGLEIRAELSGIALGAMSLHVNPNVETEVPLRPHRVRLELDGPGPVGVPHEWLYPRLVFNEELEGQDVSLDAEQHLVTMRERGSDAGCLDAFIRLADGSPTNAPTNVLEMARIYGPLMICRHRKPMTHGDLAGVCTLLTCTRYHGQDAHWEPIEAWVRYARNLRGILSAAIDLLAGFPVRPADWNDIVGAEPTECLSLDECCSNLTGEMAVEFPLAMSDIDRWRPFVPPDQLEEGRRNPILDDDRTELLLRHDPSWFDRTSLGFCIKTWVIYGNTRPLIIWRSDGIRVQLGSSPRWGKLLTCTLGLQLVATLQSPSGLFRCDGCSRPFTPPEGKRRPARNKRKWCPACGRHAQWADYQRRRYRARSAEPDTKPNATIGSTGDPTVSNPVSNSL